MATVIGILAKIQLSTFKMGKNLKSLGLENLPAEDKVSLINELWTEVVAEERMTPISEELAAKLDARVAELEANPDQVHSIEEVMATLRADREA